MDGDEAAVHPLRHPRCPAHEPIAVTRARQRHEHTFPCLPELLDALAFAVLRKPFLDTIGKPGERKLTQRR